MTGSVECALDIQTYCNTVTVDGEVSCFRLSKSAYTSLVKDRLDVIVSVNN